MRGLLGHCTNALAEVARLRFGYGARSAQIPDDVEDLDSVPGYGCKLVSLMLRIGGTTMPNRYGQEHQRRDGQESADEGVTASTLDGVVLMTLAFSCCLLPVLLPALSWVAAWLTSIPAFAMYRPWWLAVLLASSVFGWRRVYRPRLARDAARPGFGAKVIFWLSVFSAWSAVGVI